MGERLKCPPMKSSLRPPPRERQSPRRRKGTVAVGRVGEPESDPLETNPTKSNPSVSAGFGSVVLVIQRPRRDRGGIGKRARRRLIDIQFRRIPPAAAKEGLVIRAHRAAAEQGKGGQQHNGHCDSGQRSRRPLSRMAWEKELMHRETKQALSRHTIPRENSVAWQFLRISAARADCRSRFGISDFCPTYAPGAARPPRAGSMCTSTSATSGTACRTASFTLWAIPCPSVTVIPPSTFT